MNQQEIQKKTKTLLKEVNKQAKLKDKLSFFCIATTANKNNTEDIQFISIRETPSMICGSLLIKNIELLKSVLPIIDGKLHGILVDVESKLLTVPHLETYIRNNTKKTSVYPVRPNEWTADAAAYLLSSLVPKLTGKKVVIIGAGNLGCKIGMHLIEHGCQVCLNRRDTDKLTKIVEGLNELKTPYCTGYARITSNPELDIKGADIIIGATTGTPVITAKMVRKMDQEGVILDAGNGTVHKVAISLAKKRGIRILCLIAHPGFYGVTETILATKELITSIGTRNYKGFALISGGVIGERGDIIVNNYAHPTRIIGIADGYGDIISERQQNRFKNNIKQVQKLIKEKP